MTESLLPLVSNILQRLEPEEGAPVLQLFQTNLQIDILISLTGQLKKGNLPFKQGTKNMSIESIGLIVENMSRDPKRALLKALKRKDKILYSKVIAWTYLFEDLTTMPELCLQNLMLKFLQHPGANLKLASALKDMNEEVIEIICNNLSSRVAGMLREDMDYMGPILLNSVVSAQQEIINFAKNLEEEGDIIIKPLSQHLDFITELIYNTASLIERLHKKDESAWKTFLDRAAPHDLAVAIRYSSPDLKDKLSELVDLTVDDKKDVEGYSFISSYMAIKRTEDLVKSLL